MPNLPVLLSFNAAASAANSPRLRRQQSHSSGKASHPLKHGTSTAGVAIDALSVVARVAVRPVEDVTVVHQPDLADGGVDQDAGPMKAEI